jgi:hypothetical protein
MALSRALRKRIESDARERPKSGGAGPFQRGGAAQALPGLWRTGESQAAFFC